MQGQTIDDEFLEGLVEEAYAKEFAAKEGNKLFEAFLDQLHKVPDTNPHKKIILDRAIGRRYHDFEGDLMKVGLVSDLSTAGLDALAKRVAHGDFDF
jgi:hypothetical protein